MPEPFTFEDLVDADAALDALEVLFEGNEAALSLVYSLRDIAEAEMG